MKTITFYSYKGGTGRSLALANAARYLARLEFRVVAVDFDLEAPGLHYKFASTPNGDPVNVRAGMLDYLSLFLEAGKPPESLQEFVVDVPAPGIDKPLIHLLPAGRAPSSDYFGTLARINWHELFYADRAPGIQLLFELKNQIMDEFCPDFVLIDSRTGITEMGAAATSLLADRVVCLVIPTMESLEGTRSVLRSVKRTRREADCPELEITIALARLPETDRELEDVDRIRSILNEEADDPRDTPNCSEVLVLHSENVLQREESLRIGGVISSDDSVLLRDYLRLFANMVPAGLVESRVGKLIEQAKLKIWDDADAALREIEELAESFGHPEIYRQLLRFYEVRNIRGPTVLRRAQRLWDLTRSSQDLALWQAVRRSYEPRERWRIRGEEWRINTDFLAAVWRDAGDHDSEFADRLLLDCDREGKPSKAADILLEFIQAKGPSGAAVARCIEYLDLAKRTVDADNLIEQFKTELETEPKFVVGWAKHVLRSGKPEVAAELLAPRITDILVRQSAVTAARLFLRAGMPEQCDGLADDVLGNILGDELGSKDEIFELAEVFVALDRWDEFEKAMHNMRRPLPPPILDELRERHKDLVRRRSGK